MKPVANLLRKLKAQVGYVFVCSICEKLVERKVDELPPGWIENEVYEAICPECQKKMRGDE